MSSRPIRIALAGAICAVPALTVGAGHSMPAGAKDRSSAHHVLLISVDGLHQQDLTRYITNHPYSAFAGLVHQGVEYTNAKTPVPSDSFPGLMALVTGGNPKSTGIYYDDSYNHALLPAGTKSCIAGAKLGAEVTYFEVAAKDPHSLDSGQGLPYLPASILQLTGNATSLIDTAQLPVDPATCQPVYPHSYLRVNTIFEVARAAKLRTAWSDKHAAYEITDGNSGTGVQDLFTPEINSDAPFSGSPFDWTKDNQLTQQYDSYKVQAVLNEIAGKDHSGALKVGIPAIFGMNFQTVSTAQKLPSSNGLPGGYLADGVTPGPLLSHALDYIDAQLGRIRSALGESDQAGNTTIVLSAKHGQSPTDPAQLTRIPDGPIIDAINAAWKTKTGTKDDLIVQSTNDDAMIMWLSDRSDAATAFVKAQLLANNGVGNDIHGNPRPYTASGLSQVFAGAAAAAYFGVPQSDSRVPDLYAVTKVGTVFTGKKGKIAEHGGANPLDREVPLIVSGGSINAGKVNHTEVGTVSIAPTILDLLGLNPRALKSVQIEKTPLLPGLHRGNDG